MFRSLKARLDFAVPAAATAGASGLYRPPVAGTSHALPFQRQGGEPAPAGASRSNGALAATGVSIAYTNSSTGEVTPAVSQIDLTVAKGEFVSIVGLSGCGKSSFLNAVAGLTAISGGTLVAGGVPITRPGPDRAVVFQRPSLLPWRTVLGNVIYGLELQGIPKREAHRRAAAYIDLVQLGGVEHFYPAALSGGMQQRVNLARALVCDPDILLLDEPFGALDAITRETMQKELLGIWETTRKTVLMVTHQIDEAILLSDRILVFSDRPARILAEIVVELPRPRPANVKALPAFTRLETRIWELIQETARGRGRL
ncbi:ABC transporter ATP-binding protein [Ancylobacter sonchi]|uniref:ABC transporter ATP-binding protein n=1 Tax=Ancylobacter sonchi TaxID=1937790 RepID=UPI001BD38CF7|nr:ABC transporter ATP-binding protein [Ancylobacter sonchi]MBS7535192.1 ABC transporter ATP-binding protein [Ancylobacter sonchi]